MPQTNSNYNPPNQYTNNSNNFQQFDVGTTYDKKYIPPSFDLLFDPRLIHAPGMDIPNIINDTTTTTTEPENNVPRGKNHNFDFVSELLKKK
jgi:hypothetical protein